MFCGQCGASNLDGDKFCGQCGAPLGGGANAEEVKKEQAIPKNEELAVEKAVSEDVKEVKPAEQPVPKEEVQKEETEPAEQSAPKEEVKKEEPKTTVQPASKEDIKKEEVKKRTKKEETKPAEQPALKNENSTYNILYYENGDTYTGELKNGVPEGKGKMNYADGSSYVGDWRYGMRSGIGLMKFTDGSIYEGEWKYDRQNGEGIWKSNSRDKVCAGRWENDHELYTKELPKVARADYGKK